MIVVAVIGILAAVAIPNFIKLLAKAKKSAFSPNFNEIRWSPAGTVYYYAFSAGAGHLGKDIALNPPPAVVFPGATKEGFTACAWGNVDTDPERDVWYVNDLKELVNQVDDLVH
jgi:type IV pilus assembly protein PilA